MLLLPGSEDVSEYALNNDKAINWVRELYGKVDSMTAVCTGALIQQKAGLLKGGKATTY